MPDDLILNDLTDVTAELTGTRTYVDIIDEVINANTIRVNTNGWVEGWADAGTVTGRLDVDLTAPRYELTDLVRRIEELEQKYETLSTEFFRFKYDKLTPVEQDELMAMVNGGV